MINNQIVARSKTFECPIKIAGSQILVENSSLLAQLVERSAFKKFVLNQGYRNVRGSSPL